MRTCLIRRALAYLEGPHQVRPIQVLAHICVFSIQNRVEKFYEETYKLKPKSSNNTDAAENTASNSNSNNNDEDDKKPLFLLSEVPQQHSIRAGRFPKRPCWFACFRWFTSAWMIYIMVKLCLSDLIGRLLNNHVSLSRCPFPAT